MYSTKNESFKTDVFKRENEYNKIKYIRNENLFHEIEQETKSSKDGIRN